MSQAHCYRRPMIDLGTLGGLLTHGHQLAAYRPRCDTWRVLPLAELVAAGQGARRYSSEHDRAALQLILCKMSSGR